MAIYMYIQLIATFATVDVYGKKKKCRVHGPVLNRACEVSDCLNKINDTFLINLIKCI